MAQIIDSGGEWQVSGDITAPYVQALLAESESLAPKQVIQIDFSLATDVDTTSISLMLEWIRRANARGGTVAFMNIPESLMSLIKLYEVSSLIQPIKN